MTAAKQTRRLLLIGFGGLLLLLAFSGLNALSVLRKIQTQNQRIREDYLNRDRMLGQLRSDIYLSGTYARDLLLEQDPGEADTHRRELEESRRRIYENVAAYDRMLESEERAPFHQFRTELDSYFSSLRPTLEWNAAQRRTFGYAFTKNFLLPHRIVIVHLADQIGQVNQRQLEVGSQQIADLFSRFRRSLILLLVFTVLCGILLAAGSVRSILKLEQVSARRTDEAEHARESLRELSARLISVQESERRSLSRELHDEVGQSLSALLLGIANVDAVISSDRKSEAHAHLHDLRLLTEKTVAVVRDMSLLLRPSMLDDLGLIPAVQWQAREVSRNNNVYVQVLAGSVSEDLTDDQKTCIYRIVQETLRNAVRHAQAKNVRIRLCQESENLMLTIEDDGQGFSPQQEKGLGLLGMEERVMHLRGEFHVDSQPGKGASVHVTLPLIQRSVPLAV